MTGLGPDVPATSRSLLTQEVTQPLHTPGSAHQGGGSRLQLNKMQPNPRTKDFPGQHTKNERCLHHFLIFKMMCIFIIKTKLFQDKTIEMHRNVSKGTPLLAAATVTVGSWLGQGPLQLSATGT